MWAGEMTQPLKAKLRNKNKIKENKTITKDKTTINDWAWWCILAIPVLRRQRQGECPGFPVQPACQNQQMPSPNKRPFPKSKQLLRKDTGS